MILEDDKHIFPAGNVVFVTDPATVEEGRAGLRDDDREVQQSLSIPVMQELNARVDIDKQTPEQVAADYLKESGYTD